jgi:hypothetical protein
MGREIYDPAQELAILLEKRETPDFAWVVEWSKEGKDPAVAVWQASRHAGALLALAAFGGATPAVLRGPLLEIVGDAFAAKGVAFAEADLKGARKPRFEASNYQTANIRWEARVALGPSRAARPVAIAHAVDLVADVLATAKQGHSWPGSEWRKDRRDALERWAVMVRAAIQAPTLAQLLKATAKRGT